MMNAKVKSAIENSVLCWLATADNDNFPNVSPKEVFVDFDDEHLLIANIASPQSLRNIRANNQVCVSFVDVFVQKGFKIKGIAEIVKTGDLDFENLATPLLKMTEGKYPFNEIFKIKATKIKAILAPRYILYSDTTTETSQIKSALKTYRVKEFLNE